MGQAGDVGAGRGGARRRRGDGAGALLDAKGVLCLDARNAVRFAIAGDGELLHNLGTSTGSRQVELYNGRAIIRARMKKGEAAISVSAEKLPTAVMTVKG